MNETDGPGKELTSDSLATGLKPEKIAPVPLGTQGLSKDDWTTEWLAGKNWNWMVSPIEAVTESGSKTSFLSLPTVTWRGVVVEGLPPFGERGATVPDGVAAVVDVDVDAVLEESYWAEERRGRRERGRERERERERRMGVYIGVYMV